MVISCINLIFTKYFRVIKSRGMRLKGHVARIGIHVGITEGKRRI
jgi:hypothetical protein